MILAIFKLFSYLLRAKQSKTKEMKETEVQTQGDRRNCMISGYSKELTVQNVSYFMLFSSCLEKTHTLICLLHSNQGSCLDN